MKANTIFIGMAIALSILAIRYITIPTYKRIFAKSETEKPMPPRAEMIAKGTGIKPAIWNETTPKETVHNGNILKDTLTSRETIYLYPNIPDNKSGQLQIIVMSDSLSGCTNGTVYLDRNRDGIGWYQSELLRLNGSTNQQLMAYEEIEHEKVRLRIVGAYSTQATQVRATAYFKP